MPVQGPNFPTDEEVAKIYDEVIKYLEDKYNICTRSMDSPLFTERSRRSRARAKRNLRKAIKGLMWQHNCETW